jgi:hypothetical protein
MNMLTTDLSNLHGLDYVYGTLWLPSVRQHGDTIRQENITLEEAIDVIENFDERLESKKLKKFTLFGADVESCGYLVVDGIKNKSVNVEKLVQALSESIVPGFRGKRAVFVSDALSAIVIGRGVIYNKNWASLNVLDASIQNLLNNAEEL